MKKEPNQNGPTLKGRIQHTYSRFLKIRGEPREIALGLSLGIMVGMSPFMGLHTIIAVFLAAIWKWNKIAAIAGVFITNPFTAPFIYPITYVVGRAILGVSNIPKLEHLLSLNAVIELIKYSPMILVDLTVGGIILGLPLAIAAYWIAFEAIENYRRKIKPKLKGRSGRRRKKKSRRR